MSTGLGRLLVSLFRQKLARRYTTNVDAYQNYLKGRYSLNKRTTEGITKAIDYFKRVIDLDSSYWLAYAGLAEGYDKAYFCCSMRSMAWKWIPEPLEVAAFYNNLGDKDQAFVWIEKAYQDRSPYLVGLKSSSRVDILRSDPRYDDLVRRVGL